MFELKFRLYKLAIYETKISEEKKKSLKTIIPSNIKISNQYTMDPRFYYKNNNNKILHFR